MNNTPEIIRELLAARRQPPLEEINLQDVLPELHRRLRAQSMRRTSVWEVILDRARETFVFGLGREWQGLGAACALCAAGLLSFHFLVPSSPNAGSTNTLATAALKDSTISSVHFSLAEAGDSSFSTKIDQQLDRVSLADAGGADLQAKYVAGGASAQYVLTNHPVTYDTVAAF